jgi:hypothetical protein
MAITTTFFRPLLNKNNFMLETLFNSVQANSFLVRISFNSRIKRNKIVTLFRNIWTAHSLNNTRITSFSHNGQPQPLAFYKYYYNGLGYKIFLRDNYLFIWIGLTHYTILKVPNTIRIFAKKKKVFLVGSNLLKFNEFLSSIRRIRKIDLYKGKGLLEVKNYKGFIKMKSGKKKQY